MSKRKLTRHQKWRIEKVQSEKAARSERKEQDITQQQQSGQLGVEQPGLVIAHYGQQIDIEALEGSASGQIYRCHVRANLDSLVTGDRVIWRAGTDQSGVVEARLERSSLLQRPDNYGQLKPVAANIDRIIIVVATEPTPHTNLIDRYLVAAETLDIQPTLLFNKSDLIDEGNKQAIDALCQSYQDLGYEVLKASAHELALSESTLITWLQHFTSVFVGQSGVGKSSLIRSLLGDQTIKVGELSEQSRKGMHTTTTAKLFHLPGGGNIVDSPGIREFGLWHINEQQLIEGFVEFRALLGQCRFRDCKHLNEPRCAILNAFHEGKISATRMDSYQRIRATLNDKETYL